MIEYCKKSWFEYRLFYIIKVSFSDYPKMVQIVPVWYNRKKEDVTDIIIVDYFGVVENI